MELKYDYVNELNISPYCSNRTFMELKLVKDSKCLSATRF
mgnify:CR=1 FL=1